MTAVDHLGAGDDQAAIVFVRPESSCDTSDDAWLVDDTGRFVGTIPAGAAFSVHLAPGEHLLFVWPGLDPRDGACQDRTTQRTSFGGRVAGR